MSTEVRRALIDAALAMNASGINQGTSGNLSLRCGEGMLITPSGMEYADLAPEDIVYVDEGGHPQGNIEPSSEWRFHHDIYRHRVDAQAILHAHPADCATLACLHKQIPAFHYMVAVAGGRNIRCADYATFGTQELSDNILSAMDGRRACLVANHGLVCMEQDLKKALALAVEVERLARMYLQCLEVGEPVILDDAEMARVLEKFRTYGPGSR
jgi:L-fuculose-phosphate aldolase